jgi:quinol monooxygenase YgiN
MSKVRVVARVISRPDSVAHVREVLLAQVGPTRGEAGCIQYDLMQNAADPTDFTFYEEWASVEALMAHSASAHLARSRPLLEGHLVLPTDVRRYTLVE